MNHIGSPHLHPMNIIVYRDQKAYGPFPVGQARHYVSTGQLLAQDTARLDTEAASSVSRLGDLLSRCSGGSPVAAAPPPAPLPAAASACNGSSEPDALTNAIGTIRALGFKLLFPWGEITSGDWLKDRRLINLAVAGMSPAVLLTVAPSANAGYWLIALYFSVLWAFFFYYVFRTPQVRTGYALLAFGFTAFVSIAGLLQLQELEFWRYLYRFPQSKELSTRLLAYIGVVGIHEELCKAAILFWIVKRLGPLHPQTMVFYGMMAGLGFGIYEGVMYQRAVNSQMETTVAYFMNIARLTSLPFFHSIWSGMAGYFIAFAALHPKNRFGLWVLAIGIPALAHGIYDTFTWGWIGLGTVFLSVLLLTIYLKNSDSIRRHLVEAP